MRKRCKMTYPKSYSRQNTVYQVSDPALKDWVRSKVFVGNLTRFHFSGTMTQLNDAAYKSFYHVSDAPQPDGPPHRLLASLGDKFGNATLSCTIRMSETTGQVQVKHPALPYWVVRNKDFFRNNDSREAIAEVRAWEWMEGAKK